MLCDHVDAFDDNLLILGIDRKDLAFLVFILAGNNAYGITF